MKYRLRRLLELGEPGVLAVLSPRLTLLEPRAGGVILARAESKTQIESIIANDPFLIAEVARYTIVEFHPTRAAAGLEPLLS